jgi:hypothetical protein
MEPATRGEVDLSSLAQLLELLERVRTRPPGLDRIRAMNAFVRTLGQPVYLAALLDLLKAASSSEIERDAAIARTSHTGRMHCLYGWAGQTLLVASLSHPTVGTVAAAENLDSLGYPAPEWDLSIHIWQPNPETEGFESMKRLEPDVILEPPHSHPFDFVSYVSKGEIRQSIYIQDDQVPDEASREDGRRYHRYDGVTLERVDGIWPPHSERSPVRLKTLEDSVVLRAGDSYFLPYYAIHDVELDRESALVTPTITMFMPSEAIVKPRAYIAQSMADYHEQDPDLKAGGRPLTINQWRRKLDAVAAYLRGESKSLRLGEIVQCGSTYGFMHM